MNEINYPLDNSPGEESSDNTVIRRSRLLGEGDDNMTSIDQEHESFNTFTPADLPQDSQEYLDTGEEGENEVTTEHDTEDSILIEPELDEEDTAPFQIPPAQQPWSTDETPTPTLKEEDRQFQSARLKKDYVRLPNPINEIDESATRVTSAAYKSNHASDTIETRKGRLLKKPKNTAQTLSAKPYNQSPRVLSATRQPLDFSKALGCLFRSFFFSLFIFIFSALCVLSIVFYQYYKIASTLPNINDLRQRASQFETTRILDRNGRVLYEILDPNAGRRTYVPLERISPYLVAATIATEDKGFYSHPGFDPFAILRAFWQNYQGGETVSGASTITQQLARTLLFSPEERTELTYRRKVREAILAAEITRRYSRDEILELYLNEIYYGNLAYGIEAAAETYFGTTADKLNFSQAAFLAGLPQAPAIYDVYTNPSTTFNRFEDVLVLMYQLSQEQNCIFVSNNPQRVCVDPVSVTVATSEIQQYEFNNPDVQMRYPHWVNYIRSLLEEQYDPQTIYRSGFSVYTTLDPGIQAIAQKAVKEQIDAMSSQNASSGALVAVHPPSGEILAMVGSADFYNEEIDGQVNMAINPRQPGSTIKPLTYLAAFEKGWTPATLIWDVPSEFPPSGRADDPRPPYKPVNYDGRYHGAVTVRSALANSYNIPAVKALQFVGIFDDQNQPGEEGLLNMAERLGISTLTRKDYGLSLTLGGGEVTLLELTQAYATIANNGWKIPPVAITKILDNAGNIVFESQHTTGEQMARPEHSFLITSILSDNRARTPAYGANSVLNLPFPAAAKTGTSNDFRDNWTIGYTPDIAVGVWVGNADYTPMRDTSGISGAAPIWSKVMQSIADSKPVSNHTPFSKPPGIIENIICEMSGTSPSKWCPQQTKEIFAADQPPLPPEEDLWKKVAIDTWTGLRVSPACAEYTEDSFVLNVDDPWARKWIKEDSQGRSWAQVIGFAPPVTFSPERECSEKDPRPLLQFAYPRGNETIKDNPLNIYAIADASEGFDYWQLDFGFGEKPVKWKTLKIGRKRVTQPDLIHAWDLIGIKSGVITLRLFMESTEDTYAEKKIQVNIQVPTPTPTPTSTPKPTKTPQPSPTSTPTLIPTNTATPTDLPTNTPVQVVSETLTIEP